MRFSFRPAVPSMPKAPLKTPPQRLLLEKSCFSLISCVGLRPPLRGRKRPCAPLTSRLRCFSLLPRACQAAPLFAHQSNQFPSVFFLCSFHINLLCFFHATIICLPCF